MSAKQEVHDCGYPPGDAADDTHGFVRVCTACGAEWYCSHPRLGIWTRKEALARLERDAAIERAEKAEDDR